jgi:hypothetical protein
LTAPRVAVAQAEVSWVAGRGSHRSVHLLAEDPPAGSTVAVGGRGSRLVRLAVDISAPWAVTRRGDNLWRESGNLTMAQKLLRHGSPATTAAYLHPLLDDLEAALEALDE